MELRKMTESFAVLPDYVWEKFSLDWVLKEFRKKEYLLRPGEVERHLYFVKEGILRGYHVKEGIEFVVGFAHQGTPCGVIDSFLLQQPSRYYLQALTDAELWAISYEKLQSAYENYPEIERWGRLFAEKLLVGIADREISFLSSGAEERYLNLLKRNAQILQMVPQLHLASYLGMSPETFSRLRAKYARDQNS